MVKPATEYVCETYFVVNFDPGWECKDLPNGNVQIEMMNEVTIEVKRDAPGKFSVVSINDATFLPVGAVLNKLRAVE